MWVSPGGRRAPADASASPMLIARRTRRPRLAPRRGSRGGGDVRSGVLAESGFDGVGKGRPRDADRKMRSKTKRNRKNQKPENVKTEKTKTKKQEFL